MATCSDQYPTKRIYNVPRDVISYDGDEFSASKCEQKCLYSYNYIASSSCIVTNSGDRLSVRYDGGGDVTFNGASYTPTVMKLFCPSISKFNGQQTAAELVIEHTAKSAAKTGLLVCIPLSADGPPTNAAVMLQEIIKNAPIDANVSESVPLSDFNLNTIIPTAPYYTYEGPLPYDECATREIFQYVVFHPAREGAIALPKETLAALRSLIQFSFIVARPGTGIFVNETGTAGNGSSGENQIYIQCQPAGESAEEAVYQMADGKAPEMPADFIQNIFIVLVGIVIIFASFKVMQFVLDYIGKNKPDFQAPTS
jgi:hypothetical protein